MADTKTGWPGHPVHLAHRVVPGCPPCLVVQTGLSSAFFGWSGQLHHQQYRTPGPSRDIPPYWHHQLPEEPSGTSSPLLPASPLASGSKQRLLSPAASSPILFQVMDPAKVSSYLGPLCSLQKGDSHHIASDLVALTAGQDGWDYPGFIPGPHPPQVQGHWDK
jgi:hypothetical protein